jgi:CheY-like chemotaxis protein
MREGRDAFASIQENPPDLVILDLRLADASGADILESLRAHDATAEIPVIIYTAAVLEAESMANLVGGNPTRYRNVAVLQKPFEQDALLEQVRQMLAAPQPMQS